MSTTSAERAEGVPSSPTDRANRAVIAAVRIMTGLLWLANLHWKVPPAFGEDTGGGLYKYIESVTRNSPFAPFTWVTEEIVLPNFRTFGWITLIVETLVAMLLLVGYRVRPAALVGALMSVPILLSTIYYDRADEWSWAYLMMIGLNLLLFATDAGRYAGLDGVLARDGAAAQRALVALGAIATIVGLAGLYVARVTDFASRQVALLGSDAGFTATDGSVTRRWELKFMWFNPLFAILTVVGGLLLAVGARRLVGAWVGSALFALMAVVVFIDRHVDYLRDDGRIQVVSTASDAAVWGAFALAAGLLANRLRAAGDTNRSEDDTERAADGSDAHRPRPTATG
jgi:thiosulfate dehydrogenase (quinone) large subunit